MRERKNLPLTRFLAVCVFAGLLISPAHGASWSFIVAGDDRTNPHVTSGVPDPTGINTHVLTNLLHAIATDPSHPQFMLFTGDLVLGTNALFPVPITNQFQAWLDLVKAGLPTLPVLEVRGNHETYGDPDGAIWKAMFKPGLDANQVSWFPGEEGFSYCYAVPGHLDTMVFAVDQFIHEHRVNLAELKNALEYARTHDVRHIFVFAHEMAFTCGSHSDEENMAAHPEDRDKFLDLLQTYNCQFFFAGHDHAYDWMLIRNKKWPAGYMLNQIVDGTAGAPFYKDKGYYGDHHGFDLLRLDHRQNTYGYIRVLVEPDRTPVITFVEVPVK